MSFDWLNIPGLNIENTDVNSKQNEPAVPPSVSFDFGVPPPINDANTMTQESRSISDSALNMDMTNNTATPNGAFLHVNPPQHAASNNDISTVNEHKELITYKETPEDLKVPLSLSQSQLTHEEIRTYLRWYKYILARSHTKLVRLHDVFRFLGNFTINEDLKARIVAIFRSCKSALNIGQFFAVLRLISRAMIEGVLPSRRMILEKAPIPKPRPILSTQGNGEIYEEVEEEEPKSNGNDKNDGSVDFDSFTSLLLTGKTIRKRVRRKILNAAFRNKRVRFSENITFQDPPTDKVNNPQAPLSNTYGSGNNVSNADNNNEPEEAVPQGPLDLSLPMDQLLKQMASRKHNNSALVSRLPSEQQETEEEKEELKDMQDSLSHFKQIQTVDAVTGLVNDPQVGFMNNNVGNMPNGMDVNGGILQPLKPTATGSANHFMRQEMNQGYISTPSPEPSNTLQPLKPTATGSANYLVRSHFDTNENVAPVQQTQTSFQSNPVSATLPAPVISPQHTNDMQPLKPTATGSANYLMKQQFPTATPVAPQVNHIQKPTAQNDQFMNFPQQRQQVDVGQQQQQQHQQQPTAQYQNHLNVNGNIPQQNTYTNGTLNQTSTKPSIQLQPQNTYPQAQVPNVAPNMQNVPSLPPQQQQQQQYQSTGLLSPGSNAASSYFQSLLSSSHSPSPNASHVQISAPGNNGMGMQPQQPQQTMYSANNTQTPSANTSNASGYNQYQNTQHIVYQNQQIRPQQQQQQQQQQHQQQTGQHTGQQQFYPGQIQSPPPGAYNSVSQHTLGNNNQAHLGVPQYPFTGQQNRPNQPNQQILGDYHAMQNQVNALQQSYGRR